MKRTYTLNITIDTDKTSNEMLDFFCVTERQFKDSEVILDFILMTAEDSREVIEDILDSTMPDNLKAYYLFAIETMLMDDDITRINLN